MRLVRPFLVTCLLALCPFAGRAQTQPAAPTDLDRFMATALQRRDIDRKTLTDYVLDEMEVFEVLGPGRVPIARSRREFTWYVRDGIHIRSPLKVDGAPVPESDRRAYEDHWMHSELNRRKARTTRDETRAQEGKPPAMSAPSVNEPRFVSESYFMDFKFEPGNYYLAAKEPLDGHDVLKIDYLPTKLFDEEGKESKEPAKDAKAPAKESKGEKKEREQDEAIDRKMDKTSQVTLWVDPVTHQIVKYTFDNVWLDFLPGGWIVRIDDLRASMQMGQPFPGVWLPHNVSIHAGLTAAVGSLELQYRREFSNYRKADVTSKITVPKGGR
ncbi:MAG TPA: hypothetical protein VEL79_19390 [Vicinamibacterales bacterium]|nr:hypothetical protein [Vicinamibacterales bacterium]